MSRAAPLALPRADPAARPVTAHDRPERTPTNAAAGAGRGPRVAAASCWSGRHDPFEREAERTADASVRGRVPGPARALTRLRHRCCGSRSARPARRGGDQQRTRTRRAEKAPGPADRRPPGRDREHRRRRPLGRASSRGIPAMRGGGAPLDRRRCAPGSSRGSVSTSRPSAIHTDARRRARRRARARAFTVGRAHLLRRGRVPAGDRRRTAPDRPRADPHDPAEARRRHGRRGSWRHPFARSAGKGRSTRPAQDPRLRWPATSRRGS